MGLWEGEGESCRAFGISEQQEHDVLGTTGQVWFLEGEQGGVGTKGVGAGLQ